MKKNIYILIGILLLYTAAGAGNDEIIKVKAAGTASYKILPGPRSRAAALRAARIEGYKKLAEAAGLAAISHSRKFRQSIVKAYLKGARLIRKRYISDYEAEVIMEIDKKNIFRANILLLKKEIKTTKSQLENLKRKLATLTKMLNAQEKQMKREGK